MCTSKLCEVETKRYLYEPLLKTLNDNDVLLLRLRSTKSGCLASSCYAILSRCRKSSFWGRDLVPHR